MDNAAPHIKASIQLDVEAGRSEIEAMIGDRAWGAVGVPATADFIYAALPIDQRLNELIFLQIFMRHHQKGVE